MKPKNYVLVIGGVHVDTIATYQPADRKRVDKIGRIEHRIGGVAFNIANSLDRDDVPVQLFTYLDPSSPLTPAIEYDLAERRLLGPFVRQAAHPFSSGYVSQQAGGELVSAVTGPGIENVELNEAELRRAVRGARVVVADTNLSFVQLRLISDVCRERRVDLLVSVASDSKVARIARQAFAGRFKAVCMNDIEARVAGVEVDGVAEGDEPAFRAMVCGAFNSDIVIVTRGERGYVVVTPSGVLRQPVARVVRAEDLHGAGDVFFATVCKHAHRDADRLAEPDVFAEAARKAIIMLESLPLPPRAVGAKAPVTRREQSVAAVLMSVAIACIPAGFAPHVPPWLFVSLLLTVAACAGAVGGHAIRILGSATQDDRLTRHGLFFGSWAGLISALLFSVTQLVSNLDAWLVHAERGGWTLKPALDGNAGVLLFSVLVISFTGGIAFESVIVRLVKRDPQPGQDVREV